MLTLPDFKQKQILFIRPEINLSNKIRFYNDNIVFEKENKIIDRVSCFRVFSVFIIGDISITSKLIKKGIEYGISFFFLRDNFELYASINSMAKGNYLLRMRQYSLTENEELLISKNIVLNKIRNQLKLLSLRGKKIKKNKKQIEEFINSAKTLETLRGIEGNISKDFFSAYFKEVNWVARMPRVKPDIPNFLLDMGYTMIFNFLDSLLNLIGFDTYKGCYHKLFFQRKSLTCDIVEPFRCIIEKEILKMFNLRIINEKDFKLKDRKVNITSKRAKKYAVNFLEAIIKNKGEAYNYVYNFYRFLMTKEIKKFPQFSISY